MLQPVSAYVLTLDSERYLERILQQCWRFAAEVVVVDSGSTDRTLAIAEDSGARVLHHPFEDFRRQRELAAAACRHDYIFYCDCDEVPDDSLVASIQARVAQGLTHSAYWVTRDWEVLNTPVRVVYPVRCPDRLPRLYDRRRCYWETDKLVHESLVAPQPVGQLDGRLTHKTFETHAEIELKLQRYTDLAALGLVRRLQQRQHASRWRALPHLLNSLLPSPLGALVKSYLIRGGWRDGWVGLILLGYTLRYSHLKHWKAARMLWRDPQLTAESLPG
jgi:hypothetical protein|tara:strand:+ start:106 stop:933 length:828 start_codon:yes stop_codon:yes gene_type:complete